MRNTVVVFGTLTFESRQIFKPRGQEHRTKEAETESQHDYNGPLGPASHSRRNGVIELEFDGRKTLFGPGKSGPADCLSTGLQPVTGTRWKLGARHG